MDVTIPKRHIKLSRANVKSPEVVEQMILDLEPLLPDSFVTSLTLHIRDDVHPVTGVHLTDNIKNISQRMHELFSDEMMKAIDPESRDSLTVLLFYDREHEMMVGHIGIFSAISEIELPEGTFMSNQIGRA